MKKLNIEINLKKLNPKTNLLLANLNEQINFIDLEIDNPIHKCEKAIENRIIYSSIAF